MPQRGANQRARPSSAELSKWFHRARKNVPGALEQLLLLYRPLLLKIAHQRLKKPLQVKVAPSDLVQSTMWKASGNFGKESFEDRNAFVAWLTTILKHEAKDVYRRFQVAKKRDISRERPLLSPETKELLRRLSDRLSTTAPGNFQPFDDVERLLSALDRLPPHYQLVLKLRYYEKLKFVEIAVKLDRSADAVRVLHNRALLRLRDQLQDGEL